MPIEHREPDRGLVAEGYRQRLLQMGAPGHRRITMALRQVDQDAAQRGNVLLDDRKPGAELQHERAIHDVLRGRTPMHVTAGLAALLRHLVHQRQDRIADDVGLVAQGVEIECRHVGARRDLVRGGLGDYAAARLGPRQCDLDLDIARDQREVGKHFAHRRRAEGIAKQNRSRERWWRSGKAALDVLGDAKAGYELASSTSSSRRTPGRRQCSFFFDERPILLSSYPAHGIQYTATSRFHRRRLWNAGSSGHRRAEAPSFGRLCRTTTVESAAHCRAMTHMRNRSAARCARDSAGNFRPLKQRARGMPGAQCTRSLVCAMGS